MSHDAVGPAGTPAPLRPPAPGSLATPEGPGPLQPPGPPQPTAWASMPVVPAPPSRFSRDMNTFWAGTRPGASVAVLSACAAVGVAAGVLLVGNRAGLGAALVGVAAWTVAIPALVRRRSVGDLVLAAWSIALLVMMAVRDAGWVVALCVVVAIGVAAASTTAARSVWAVLLAPLSAATGGIRALPWVTHGAREAAGARGRGLWVAVRSGALAVGLVVVFGALFASADPVFASYLPEVHLAELPGRIVVGLLVGGLAATAAHLARTPPPWSDVTFPAPRPAGLAAWMLPVAALDAVVLAFLLVQVGALVGGSEYVEQTAGLWYADYAHQGFGQLVAATALTLVVVAVAARRAPTGTPRDRVAIRVGLGLLCVGTLGVVASALVRMNLYVDAFGLTRLRLLATWGEVAMGVIVVLVIVAGVRWRGSWVPRAVVHVVAVAMLSLALVNPDAQIVTHNAAAQTSGRGVDLLYLQGLSADAAPALDALPEPARSCALSRLDVAPVSGPADWNLGRSRAERILAAGVQRPATCADTVDLVGSTTTDG